MQVIWSETAISNLIEIRKYVALDKPVAARRLARHILATVEELKKHPHLGRTGREPETRELIVAGTPYIIVYGVERKALAVHAVLHAVRQRTEAKSSGGD